MRIYSLIIISLTLVINLLSILRDNKKSARIAAFISFGLYLPVWYYLLKF